MPVNNPATLSIGNSKDESFTYEGGSAPYNFSPYDSGLSRTLEMNIIVFANNEEHAKDIISDLFDFMIDTQNLYEANTGSTPFYDRREKLRDYLHARKKWVVKLAPMNQPYIVSWASNDTL